MSLARVPSLKLQPTSSESPWILDVKACLQHYSRTLLVPPHPRRLLTRFYQTWATHSPYIIRPMSQPSCSSASLDTSVSLLNLLGLHNLFPIYLSFLTHNFTMQHSDGVLHDQRTFLTCLHFPAFAPATLLRDVSMANDRLFLINLPYAKLAKEQIRVLTTHRALLSYQGRLIGSVRLYHFILYILEHGCLSLLRLSEIPLLSAIRHAIQVEHWVPNIMWPLSCNMDRRDASDFMLMVAGTKRGQSKKSRI